MAGNRMIAKRTMDVHGEREALAWAQENFSRLSSLYQGQWIAVCEGKVLGANPNRFRLVNELVDIRLGGSGVATLIYIDAATVSNQEISEALCIEETWFEQNYQQLMIQYPQEYVALLGEKVIAHANTADELTKQVRRAKVAQRVFVAYLELVH